MSEPLSPDRHQLRTLILAAAILAGAILVTLIVSLLAHTMDAISFLRFPLGFYLAAQGLFVLISALAFWFAREQDHLDAAREESDNF
jgi:putative solute:sodium symporter small subunit